MKDDLIRKYSSGISDEFIKEYAEFSKKALTANTADNEALSVSTPVNDGSVRVKTYSSGDSKRGGAVIWKYLITAAAVVIFIFAGLMLGRYMRLKPASDPTDNAYPTPTEIFSGMPVPSETLPATATDVPDPSNTAEVNDSPTLLPDETVSASSPDTAGTSDPTATLTGEPAPLTSTSFSSTPTTTSGSATPTSGTAIPTSTPGPQTPTPTQPSTTATEPAVTPTDDPREEYIDAKLEYVYIYRGSDDDFYNISMTSDSSDIYANFSQDSVRFVGYAYNSISPLKEIFCRLNDWSQEYYGKGVYVDRSDAALNAGYSAETAYRSGFGSADEEPMLMEGLTDFGDLPLDGIYILSIYARFENGTVYKIKDMRLMVTPGVTDEIEFGGPRYQAQPDPDLINFNLAYCSDNQYSRDMRLGIVHAETDEGLIRDFGPGWYLDLVRFDNDSEDTNGRKIGLGNINTSLFSSCIIEYYTRYDWRAYDEGSMSEPSFFALKIGAESGGCGSGNNGPYKDGIIASALLSDPDEADSNHPDFSTTRRAVIDLSNLNDTYELFLANYGNPDSPVYVIGIYFYV